MTTWARLQMWWHRQPKDQKARPNDQSTNGPISNPITIIGGGLAGTEAAWQLAERGHAVRLFEMRPTRPTEAHTGDRLAELVCSNSMGSTLPDRALGMLEFQSGC